MMQYKHIVVDCSDLFWKVAMGSFKKGEGVRGYKVFPKAIQMALKKIKGLKEDYGYIDTVVYLLFDNPESAIKYRQFISEGKYKSSREKKKAPHGMYEALNIFMEIVKSYDNYWKFFQVTGLEADDLTYPLLEHVAPNETNRVLFVSSDLDWARNITDSSHWFNWKTIYQKENFQTEHGFSPVGNSIKIYKAIRGDASDSISPGVLNIPEKLVLDIVLKFCTIDELVRGVDKTDYPDKWKQEIKNRRQELMVNYQLVDFANIELDVPQMLYSCEERIGQLCAWFKVIGIPPEPRMIRNRKPEDFFALNQQ